MHDDCILIAWDDLSLGARAYADLEPISSRSQADLDTRSLGPPACKCSPRRDRVALPRYADLEHEIESWVREQRMRQWVRQHQRLERQYWERQQQRHLSFERLLASAAPPRRPHASVTETAGYVDVDAAIRQAGAEAVAARDATAAAADRSEVALQRAALAATSGDTAGARLAALETSLMATDGH